MNMDYPEVKNVENYSLKWFTQVPRSIAPGPAGTILCWYVSFPTGSPPEAL